MIHGIVASKPYNPAVSGAGEELYDVVRALLHFNAADGSTTFTDQKGITWTATGDPEIDTAQSVFGGSALHLDGNDYITSTHASLAWGTGDFTIECWVRFSSRSGNNFVFNWGAGWGLYTRNNAWSVFDGAASEVIATVGTVADNTWYHVTVCRHSGTLRLFVNGTQLGSNVAHTTNHSTANLRLGAQPAGTGTMTGWIDDLRATAAARYVSNFTAPAAEFANRRGDPNFANVTALLHFDTDFSDVLGHTFTANGSAAISSTQSKFGGSSMRIPSSGSYLRALADAAFSVSNQSYTIEFWVRMDAVSGTQVLYDMRPFGAGGAGPMATLVGARLDVYLNSGYRVQAGTLVAATWHHIAITRDGTTARVFLDGVQLGSNYTDTNNYPATQNILLARFSDSGSFNPVAYFDEFRFTQGLCRYTSNFAPLPVAFSDSL